MIVQIPYHYSLFERIPNDIIDDKYLTWDALWAIKDI